MRRISGCLSIVFFSHILCAHADEGVPRAVDVARTTDIPPCTAFVDAAAASAGDGTASKPHKSISAAASAVEANAIICVAEGTYPEEILPGVKPFTLAGGFQSGKGFKVRNSATYISKAQGKGGGSFLKIVDPGPPADALTVIDGFEITGYSQAIVRDYWEPQRFDITNNFIHDNTCTNQELTGSAFALVNTSGTIKGNVIRKNACGRGGGGTLVDNLSKNTILVANNLVDGNSGTEPSAHGGGFYFFVNNLTVTGNLFTGNTVTQWGGGLFVGAYTAGGQITNATMRWNVYRGNKAGDSGGGFFCDEGATCTSEHELYVANCGGNVLVDGGAEGSGPTTSRFDHITNVGALSPECDAPGIGFWVDTYDAFAPDSHTISNAIFWGNADGKDIMATCANRCAQLKVAVDNSMLMVTPGEGIKIVYGGNIVPPVDPQFVAADKGDYRLKPKSPAEGKGKPTGINLGAFSTNQIPSPQSAAAPPTPPTVAPAAAKVVAAPQTTQPVKAAEAPQSAPAELARPSAPSPATGADDAKIKQAFDDAKVLGTIAAWRAFLTNFPQGYYSDLAIAYLRNLGYVPGSGAPSPVGTASPPAAPQPPPLAAPTPQAPPATPAQVAQPAPPSTATSKPPTAALPSQAAVISRAPAVKRGARFFAFPEKFNRYYTDATWKPDKTIFVSPTGSGDGNTRDKPADLTNAVNAARPGTMIYVLRGAYQGGIEFTKETGGTYDAPIVIYGERNDDASIGVTVNCDSGRRQTCFNFENADYVAVDGFELVGGQYGVRAVGAGFAASEHSHGIAILNNRAHDQLRDPYKTAQADWSVLEKNLGYGAKKGDGHGIYISGGSDWGIVRNNETHSNESSDLQINADPTSNCKDVGIAFNDPQCDAYAGEGEGGRGASDYFLIENNYCHRSAVGPNFTSLRRSMIRNNIFGPQSRHNASFWQETDNPKLSSSENRILNNLFITTRRHAVKFENNSGRNVFANNIVLGVNIEGTKVTANPSALLMEVDASSVGNVYQSNIYVSGQFEGRTAEPGEISLSEFSQSWFKAIPTTISDKIDGFMPMAGSPFLDKGKLSPEVPTDLLGVTRRDPSDIGPLEAP